MNTIVYVQDHLVNYFDLIILYLVKVALVIIGAELIDSLQGFQITHSLGDGTVVEPYNATLYVHQLVETARSLLCFYEETGAGQFVPRNLNHQLKYSATHIDLNH
eukprot:11030_1